ncbi:hypothetical protein lbkm_2837 [Lachnospiraceae bacterium KM106-2]|nr:hypothetical protein lbkm_2837 [Lachnospiraceae bacterium KM106-2]
MDSEKITINLGAIEIGLIDLLVEQGYYSNRSDFIRTAIRNQLEKQDVKELLRSPLPPITESDYSETNLNLTTGIIKLGRKELEHYKMQNTKINIKMVGLLIIDVDVTTRLIKETIKSVKVYGKIRATEEIKKVLSNM